MRVLDYGCGSGILAIGAALFGGRDIDAVDIDPAAVESTRANASANGVTLDGWQAEGRADRRREDRDSHHAPSPSAVASR